jgi:hypothetical protein
MRKTIRKVTMVVMTSCQVSLKPKIGPVTAHTITTATANKKVTGLPEIRAVITASRPNQSPFDRAPADVFAMGKFDRIVTLVRC